MHLCPKCSSIRIAGPTYRNDTYGETLAYRCMNCGYVSHTRTHDADNARTTLVRAFNQWIPSTPGTRDG